MATHSSTLAWRVLWTEEPSRLQSMGSDTAERLHFHFHFPLSRIGEGNGNPLQCSCLENPRDRGGWWAAIYGVVQSQTQLKRLSSSSSRDIAKVQVEGKETKPVNPKGNQPEYSLEGLMLKLKLQFFGHLMRRDNSLKKTLMLGKTEGKGEEGSRRL